MYVCDGEVHGELRSKQRCLVALTQRLSCLFRTGETAAGHDRYGHECTKGRWYSIRGGVAFMHVEMYWHMYRRIMIQLQITDYLRRLDPD